MSTRDQTKSNLPEKDPPNRARDNSSSAADDVRTGAPLEIEALEPRILLSATWVTQGDGPALQGDDEADMLQGTAEDDAIYGGGGDDTLHGYDGADTLLGEAGDDDLFGAGGNDALSGGAGADKLEAGEGDDVLDGGAGSDDLFGGGGMDTADYSGSPHAVTVDLKAGKAYEADDANSVDTLKSIENVIGSDYDDVLTGDKNDNVLGGGAGDDMLVGGGGHDTLEGGAGDDAFGFAGAGKGDVYDVSGGSGEDTLDLRDYSSDQVTMNENEIVVNLAQNKSFTIHHDGVERIELADQTVELADAPPDDAAVDSSGGATDESTGGETASDSGATEDDGFAAQDGSTTDSGAPDGDDSGSEVATDSAVDSSSTSGDSGSTDIDPGADDTDTGEAPAGSSAGADYTEPAGGGSDSADDPADPMNQDDDASDTDSVATSAPPSDTSSEAPGAGAADESGADDQLDVIDSGAPASDADETQDGPEPDGGLADASGDSVDMQDSVAASSSTDPAPGFVTDESMSGNFDPPSDSLDAAPATDADADSAFSDNPADVESVDDALPDLDSSVAENPSGPSDVPNEPAVASSTTQTDLDAPANQDAAVTDFGSNAGDDAATDVGSSFAGNPADTPGAPNEPAVSTGASQPGPGSTTASNEPATDSAWDGTEDLRVLNPAANFEGVEQVRSAPPASDHWSYADATADAGAAIDDPQSLSHSFVAQELPPAQIHGTPRELSVSSDWHGRSFHEVFDDAGAVEISPLADARGAIPHVHGMNATDADSRSGNAAAQPDTPPEEAAPGYVVRSRTFVDDALRAAIPEPRAGGFLAALWGLFRGLGGRPSREEELVAAENRKADGERRGK